MLEHRRLKTTEIAQIREEILAEQQGLCALCSDPIKPGEAVLDHCHLTGLIRGVLHRGCNAFEGIIVNAGPRNLITLHRLVIIMSRLVKYQKNTRPLYHPTHKTPEEKKERAKKRARARRVAKSTK